MSTELGLADACGACFEVAAESSPAPLGTVVAFGFWIFLLSDIAMFSVLFAGYPVLANATAGGPGPAQLFDQRDVAAETAFLLLSSYTCGLISLAANARCSSGVVLGAAGTFILGAGFHLELREFQAMIAIGATPQRSAFLSESLHWWGATGSMLPPG